jgi:hypothetical protein
VSPSRLTGDQLLGYLAVAPLMQEWLRGLEFGGLLPGQEPWADLYWHESASARAIVEAFRRLHG